MADKQSINCGMGEPKYGEVTYEDFTLEEIAQREQQRLDAEQQAQLDLLIPSQEEIEKAERQVNLINDLTELGVI